MSLLQTKFNNKKLDMEEFDSTLLENYLVKKAPPSVYYIPNIISQDEEEYLIRNVYAAPKPKWTNLSNRRLQDYGGIAHKNGLIPDTIPTWLKATMDRISDMGVFGNKASIQLRANHCLVNEYTPGQGIMPHFDGPLFTPVITTLTCGSHHILVFRNNSVERDVVCKLLLERCSLVIITGDMYTKYLHSIDEVATDVIDASVANLEQSSAKFGDVLKRDTRISFTIRNVQKVIKTNLFPLKRGS